MRLYRISAVIIKDIKESESESGSLTFRRKYVGSQADAAAARKVFIEAGAKRKDIESVEVNVPTDKEGLIAFLNDPNN
jgi:hypothetical protein